MDDDDAKRKAIALDVEQVLTQALPGTRVRLFDARGKGHDELMAEIAAFVAEEDAEPDTPEDDANALSS